MYKLNFSRKIIDMKNNAISSLKIIEIIYLPNIPYNNLIKTYIKANPILVIVFYAHILRKCNL